MSKLSNIFSSVLGVADENVTPELSIDNTPSWDSLNAIILLTEIEKAFDVKFEYNEAMEVKNFSEARKLLSSKGKDPDQE